RSEHHHRDHMVHLPTPPPKRCQDQPLRTTSPHRTLKRISCWSIKASRSATMVGNAQLAAMAKGASCATSNSFTADTVVLMADGSTKAIADVRVGDLVLATDPETGETRAEEVTALIVGSGSKNLVKVTIDGGEGSDTAEVIATDKHPFWVSGLNEWVDATDLRAGQWLRTGTGTRVQITALERWVNPQVTVHNITVDDLHTYYELFRATSRLLSVAGEMRRKSETRRMITAT
ncbi:polymorphic toxin-type HINT domain-containing protein, partial [Actinoplanes sp. NBRC 101535]|uniref:polymorphic toxin-type HINT domain-containing protein n=1 Tax=Actinoplanes sp. NBRC 101535 TaxID=3032196 RepID=UPI002555A604